tara:strand:- start:456 stop:713 length:258 start_codon:yes stop_codon:yes gene_type:complete
MEEEENNILQEKPRLPYYRDSVKRAIYNWRENHYEKFREYANEKGLENYYANKDKILEKAKKRYAERKLYDCDREFKRFCKMDII